MPKAMIATVTHARVRAAQGDVEGALRVLRGVLAADPEDAEALRLRAELTAADPGDARGKAATRVRAWIRRLRAARAGGP